MGRSKAKEDEERCIHVWLLDKEESGVRYFRCRHCPARVQSVPNQPRFSELFGSPPRDTNQNQPNTTGAQDGERD